MGLSRPELGSGQEAWLQHSHMQWCPYRMKSQRATPVADACRGWHVGVQTLFAIPCHAADSSQQLFPSIPRQGARKLLSVTFGIAFILTYLCTWQEHPCI